MEMKSGTISEKISKKVVKHKDGTKSTTDVMLANWKLFADFLEKHKDFAVYVDEDVSGLPQTDERIKIIDLLRDEWGLNIQGQFGYGTKENKALVKNANEAIRNHWDEIIQPQIEALKQQQNAPIEDQVEDSVAELPSTNSVSDDLPEDIYRVYINSPYWQNVREELINRIRQTMSELNSQFENMSGYSPALVRFLEYSVLMEIREKMDANKTKSD